MNQLAGGGAQWFADQQLAIEPYSRTDDEQAGQPNIFWPRIKNKIMIKNGFSDAQGKAKQDER